MRKRVATCVCGQLSASCSGDPAQVSLCHCLACQLRTGSTYDIAAFFARVYVILAGDAKTYTRSSDSGYPVTFHFCPNCGSTVYWMPDPKPEMVAVAVGPWPIRPYLRRLKQSMLNTGADGFWGRQVRGIISLGLRRA